jgi:hypothetical protein
MELPHPVDLRKNNKISGIDTAGDFLLLSQ